MRAVVPELLTGHADLVQRYDIEVLAAAPELAGRVRNERTTLTSEADPQTRTRYYPHNRTAWIGSGLADLTLAAAALRGPGQTLVITEAEHLDATDNSWLAGLVRRADPEVLQIVVATGGGDVAGPLRQVLADHAQRRSVADVPDPASSDVRSYVAGLCLDADLDLRAAYDALSPTSGRACTTTRRPDSRRSARRLFTAGRSRSTANTGLTESWPRARSRQQCRTR